jgi:hypothetical protein
MQGTQHVRQSLETLVVVVVLAAINCKGLRRCWFRILRYSTRTPGRIRLLCFLITYTVQSRGTQTVMFCQQLVPGLRPFTWDP